MFDVIRIGKYISFLRKNSKLTQGQLAEKLGVSHQAVSNWERGETMPDIALLTKLASVLNTTTDRILLSGEEMDGAENTNNTALNTEVQAVESTARIETDKSRTPDERINESIVETERNIEEREERVKELKNTITILKKRLSSAKSQSAIEKLEELIDNVEGQVDELQEEIEEFQEMIEEETEELEELDELADLEGLAGLNGLAGAGKLFCVKWNEEEKQKAKIEKERIKNERLGFNFDMEGFKSNLNIEDMENMDWRKVISIAPFASRETLDILVTKLKEKADFDKIKGLAPFLSSETLDKLISGVEEKSDYIKIVGLAPFLNSSTLDRLILTAYNEGENPSWDTIIKLAPFSSGETLEKLISKLDKGVQFDKIKQLAPFLNSATLDKVVMDAYNDGDNVNWKIIMGLVPFLSRESLNLIISKFDMKKDIDKIIELAPFLGSGTIDRIINNFCK